MSEKSDRDIEKGYSVKEFVAKLRRLADALEQGNPFSIQVAGERIYVPADASISVVEPALYFSLISAPSSIAFLTSATESFFIESRIIRGTPEREDRRLIISLLSLIIQTCCAIWVALKKQWNSQSALLT